MTTQRAPRARRSDGWLMRMAPLAGVVAALTVSGEAAAAPACKPTKPRPPIVLKTMGVCGFDLQALAFSGTPLDQALCLMRGMDRTRNLGPPRDRLPPALASRIGQSAGLPSREALSAYLSRENLEWDLAANLWRPLSRARDDDPSAPQARYFVIHDTSGPNYGRRPFPANIDMHPKINDLRNFRCSDNWEKAHVVVNRSGAMLVGHDFGIPWRETKFERAKNFDGALKGLFLHVELIQPRRRAPGRRHNDALAPMPGFSAAQYDRLALLYVIASVRAGEWIIPAFHAAIDAGIPGGHDDPLNFNIDAFARTLDDVVDRLTQEESKLSRNP